MSQSAVIFQAQPNGGYKGIYVANDGYINGVGAMLYHCYQDMNKTTDLIDSRSVVSSLGATGEWLNATSITDVRRRENVEVSNQWMHRYTIVDKNEKLALLADDEEEIALETYEAHDNHGNVCQGLDNIGYYYYQEADGEWYVAYKDADRQFIIKPLSQIFK